jgi:alanyl-tRNA synthetase
VLFKLYDTFGFPLDLTQDILRGHGIASDEAGFRAEMEAQRARSREAWRGSGDASVAEVYGRIAADLATQFVGYDTLEHEAEIRVLLVGGRLADEAGAGSEVEIVVAETPFYAESGGQVGDRGELAGKSGTFAVEDTQKIQPAVFGHKGVVKTGRLRVGDRVMAGVEALTRARTMRNHSATHLMHKALREVLGPHVQQKGSLVDAERTRFDFSHNEPVTDGEIRRVEAIVNAEILANTATSARIMKHDAALKAGALAFFGDKYGDEVRVLDIGSSRELCGGTHVARTGDIGFFKVISEGGIAAGVRRIEATTGEGALAWVQGQEARLAEASAALKAPPQELAQKIAQILEAVKTLEREVARLKSKLASSQGDELADRVVEVKGAKVLAATVDGADARALREAMDKLKDKLKSAAIVLAAADKGKVSLVAGVTPDLMGKLKAGDLVNFVAQQVGGKGGGRADMAQAGGTNPAALPAALESVAGWVRERL